MIKPIQSIVEAYLRKASIQKDDDLIFPQQDYQTLANNLISLLRKELEARDGEFEEREKKLAEWIDGHIGASSESLYLYMTVGKIPAPFDAPSDEGDRGRCVVLLKARPEWIPRLSEIEALNLKGFRNQKPVFPWNEQIPLILSSLHPHEQKVGEEIVICPIHGNVELKIEPTHYCKYKIGESCKCVCICPPHEEKGCCRGCKISPKNNDDLDYQFPSYCENKDCPCHTKDLI